MKKETPRTPNKVLLFAKINGYDNVIYKCEWEGYLIFEPYWEHVKEPLYIGEPQYILYKMGKVRFCALEEYSKFVDYLEE